MSLIVYFVSILLSHLLASFHHRHCSKYGHHCNRHEMLLQCSDHPLQFIHLTYKPKGEVKKKVAVVGKGLTFDSGGYQIKAGTCLVLIV